MIRYLTLTVVLFLVAGCSTTVTVKRKFPDVPTELTTPCPDLKQTEPTSKLSEVLKVVSENYSQYHECQLKNDTWNEWYKTQKEIFESVK
jgi:biotin-(acetyl-CoA carboxylase) ligase